ncbi:hypothetical protein [Gemmata sp.]|uniref:hypothetical protein n=1 Tax=Gemmata sp. TaxID=1914242 RepID=UPI003F70C509
MRAARGGLVDLDLVFVMRVGTRRAFVAAISTNPTGEWTTRLTRNASMEVAEWGLRATHVLIDHDAKHREAFDAVLVADGSEVKRVGPRVPT